MNAMVEDPFHVNKVDVLESDLAGQFPGLQAGDLLISVRNLNLVLICAQTRNGSSVALWPDGQQHDTSFTSDGTIEVFNNASYLGQPSIRRLDYDRQDFEEVFDLTAWGMEMRRKGNFEREGDRLLTVTTTRGG